MWRKTSLLFLSLRQWRQHCRSSSFVSRSDLRTVAEKLRSEEVWNLGQIDGFIGFLRVLAWSLSPCFVMVYFSLYEHHCSSCCFSSSSFVWCRCRRRCCCSGTEWFFVVALRGIAHQSWQVSCWQAWKTVMACTESSEGFICQLHWWTGEVTQMVST